MLELLRLLIFLWLLPLTVVPCLLVLSALAPRRISRVARLAEQRPGRAFGVGLVNIAFLLGLVLLLLTLADRTGRAFLALPGLLLLLLLGAGLALGLAGVIQLLGSRLLPNQPRLPQHALSALLLTLGCLAPLAGWFLLLPYVGALGFGALLLTFLLPEN